MSSLWASNMTMMRSDLCYMEGISVDTQTYVTCVDASDIRMIGVGTQTYAQMMMRGKKHTGTYTDVQMPREGG
eukprot:117025-Rhodomonas_salina.1